VSQSCRAVGISRQTFYRWCKGYKSDTFNIAVKEVEESLYDDAESIIYEKIFVNKDTQMLIHFSSTKNEIERLW
jgi:intein-encoded DNA endonuclease-like protein